MRTLLCFLALTVSAFAQSWTIPSFGGTVAPGVHAAFHTPEVLSYSENMFTQQGSRVTRYGITKALGTAFVYPFTGLHDFLAASDSLTVLLFSRGKWYYTSYGKYTYTGSNWRTKSTYFGAQYIATDTLHTPTEIRPYTAGISVSVDTATKVVVMGASTVTKWMAFAEPGDSVYVDTSAGQSGKWALSGLVRFPESDSRLVLTAKSIIIENGAAMQLRRGFDSAAVPSAVTIQRDAYVTNAKNPPHRMYDSLGAIYMQEADLAYAGQISHAELFFKDSVSDLQSWESYNSSCQKMRTKYLRIYDHNAAWSSGEWSGDPSSGLSTMYFCRLGAITPGSTDAAMQTGHPVGAIAPIIYNDANSLVLLLPFSGDSTYEKSVYPYSEWYPSFGDSLSDTTEFNLRLRTDLYQDMYYIFSGAGKFETVLADSQTTESARTKFGGSLWWVKGIDSELLFDDSSYNDGTYFLHLIDQPLVRNQFRTIDSVTWKYMNVSSLRDKTTIPSDWQFIERIPRKPYQDPPGSGFFADLEGKMEEVRKGYWDRYRYLSEPGDFIDWPNFAYWPIRYVRRDTASGSDTAYIITSIPPDTTMTGVTVSRNWEIVRMRLPRFAGLAANNDNTVFGWGDPVSPELVSRSVSSGLRGGEAMNWSAGSDFVVTPSGEPTLRVVPFDGMELVFTPHSIWGAGIFEEGFQITEIAQDVGLVAPNSVVVRGKTVFFESDDGYYQISRRVNQGYEVTKVSAQLDEVLNPKKRYGNSGHSGTRRVANANRNSLINSVYSPLDERLWLFYADDTASVPTHSMTLDPSTGAWDGFHNIGAIRATSLYLRDSMRVLASAPRTGMLFWLGTGQTDTGQAIRSILEGAVFNIGHDSMVVKPTEAWLTMSAANWNSGSEDSFYFQMMAIPQNVAHRDSLLKLPAECNYTYTRPFYFHDAGSARYWMWQLVYKSDTAVPRRWIQPIRMTINFTPGRAGYP